MFFGNVWAGGGSEAIGSLPETLSQLVSKTVSAKTQRRRGIPRFKVAVETKMGAVVAPWKKAGKVEREKVPTCSSPAHGRVFLVESEQGNVSEGVNG